MVQAASPALSWLPGIFCRQPDNVDVFPGSKGEGERPTVEPHHQLDHWKGRGVGPTSGRSLNAFDITFDHRLSAATK
jgi:hypothetical protein